MELINENVKVCKSPIHGWGVFATTDIKENTIIIQTPGIIINTSNVHPESILLHSYPFDAKKCIIGLGYASLINSSDEPNVEFQVDTENEIIIIKTIQDIKINQEITFKYL
jgi:SET domain-containing protein